MGRVWEGGGVMDRMRYRCDTYIRACNNFENSPACQKLMCSICEKEICIGEGLVHHSLDGYDEEGLITYAHEECALKERVNHA